MKRLLWPILAILMMAAAGLWWRVHSVPAVITAIAESGTAVDAVTGTVKVFASLDLKVQTEREGRLVELLVAVGTKVDEGQLMAVQDSRDLEFQIAEERVRRDAALARAAIPKPRTFDIETLEREVEALRMEVDLGQSPRSRLEQLERELGKQRAWLANEEIAEKQDAGVLQARVAQLEYEAGKMQITAPFEGEVVEIYVTEGTQMDRNADLLRLISFGRTVEMELNEEDMGGAAPGQRVTLRLASYGDREFTGTVSSLGATADAEQKTRKLFVEIGGDQSLLVPGLTGEGYLVKQERAEAVLIPRRALRGNRVWVVNAGRVEIREVQPGYLSLHRAEILNGLEVGEKVVTGEHDSLAPGQRVRER